MLKYIFFFMLIILIPINKAHANLAPFETDYCTYFPEGTLSRPTLWAECCLYHDLKYWIGGTVEEQLASDLKLKSCVEEKANSFYAQMMYQGIRLGHHSPIKSKYRWGWGFNKEGHFNSLTPTQKLLAKSLIEQTNLDPSLKELFIQEYLR
jgi:hypothetical protein